MVSLVPSDAGWPTLELPFLLMVVPILSDCSQPIHNHSELSLVPLQRGKRISYLGDFGTVSLGSSDSNGQLLHLGGHTGHLIFKVWWWFWRGHGGKQGLGGWAKNGVALV
jgi:hypothetical protein